MSSLRKMLSVLELFSADRTTLSAEEIAGELGFVRTTGYRYMKELCDAGLLARISGRYSLGPRIIEFDFQMRESDPVLLAAIGPMRSLVEETGLDLLLSRIYNTQVINVHQEMGRDLVLLNYGRGRAMPLFRSSTSKIILAHMKRSQLMRVYERSVDDPHRCQLGDSWKEFGRTLRKMRQQGYCISRGELNEGVVGISVALYPVDGDVLGSVTLVGHDKRLALFNEETLVSALKHTATTIVERLQTTPT